MFALSCSNLFSLHRIDERRKKEREREGERERERERESNTLKSCLCIQGSQQKRIEFRLFPTSVLIPVCYGYCNAEVPTWHCVHMSYLVSVSCGASAAAIAMHTRSH